ncbi:putative nwd2 protein [Mycena sanguinolenta]|uniref:Putative nwd2 protein n=1 Tax=Mycena sanguinolenta TaxID=230812 RepID=A0A8H6U209_9AGAR|nr:putative nwd2 protein [Mycena sanguinolenta]
MLGDLREWAMDPHPKTTILWLFGPAGAGKSAVMQTLAHQLQDSGRLGGSFFFKRGHATRGNGKTLFATIAYQLALGVPWLRTSISRIVEDDPSIVVRSFETQMRRLISEPCRAHADRHSVAILIDGLDECQGHDSQQEILRAMRRSCFNQPNPLRFIVASRPEPHIREVFDSAVYLGDYRSFNVEQSFDDVRTYLRDEFSRIHREHRTMAKSPLPWPSSDVLDRLVGTSSGHFIYAATIVKFIDDKNYRPIQRLAVVLEGSQGSELAFDALDQLYMTILDSAPRQAELVPILCAVANFDLTAAEVDQLLELADGETRLLLRGLHSVLQLPPNHQRVISFHHASFLDFLNNRTRSHNFCVSTPSHRVHLAQCFLRLCASRRYQLAWAHVSQPRRPQRHLIPFLTALPPSVELCPLIERMEPDHFFAQDSDNFEPMLSWLKRIPSAPQDLIELWEDYVYMSSMERNTWSVKKINSPSSELCQVLVAKGFLQYGLPSVRRVLGMTWSELRTIICSVQPKIANEEQTVHGSAEHVLQALVPLEMRRWICRDIALNCIRRIVKGYADGDEMDAADEWFDLARVFRACPRCPILYSEFQSIPRSAMKLGLSGNLILIEWIAEWLESFGDPTLELGAFWTHAMLPMRFQRF